MPDRAQRESLLNQATILVVKALVEHGPETLKQKYTRHPQLQFKPRRPLPEGYRTKIQAMESVTGRHSADLYTSLLQETYTTRLKIDEKLLDNRAIPSVNSSAVNKGIRAAQMAIRRQPKPWTPEQQLMMSLQVCTPSSHYLLASAHFPLAHIAGTRSTRRLQAVCPRDYEQYPWSIGGTI